MPEEFDYGDYDLEEDVSPVPLTQALPYPDVEKNDLPLASEFSQRLGFTSVVGVKPGEAIATARSWSKSRKFVGVGMCLATVRQYYGVPAGVATAADSWQMSEHKRQVANGLACPRGTPVYWTGGSKGAGHIAISIGGGLCYSTDWKEAGKIDIARIDEITTLWGLDFKGYTFEVNGVQVWKPAPPEPTVHLHNLQPGDRNDDVLKVKKALHDKGYRGFFVNSKRFGVGTKRAYAKFQSRLGYNGKDANGIPGRLSLRRLGFKVAT